MRNKIYEKSILREILYTKARFISILLIIFLGVAFFSGIKSTGPDMDKSINNYYKEQNLMDSKIISSLGLSQKDIDLLKNDDKIDDFYQSRTVDANLTNFNSVVRFMEYSKNNDINKYLVLDGKLPENTGEIALDERAFEVDDKLKIGDEFTIETDKDTMKSFKQKTYKIVGMVKSPMYIEKESRGATNVGKGTVDYFAVLNSNDISMDVYTEIYVNFKNLKGVDTYSKEYKEKIEENNKYLEKLYSKRKIDRVEEIKADAQIEIDKATKEVEDGRAELDKGKQQYQQGLIDYDKNIENAQMQISQGKTQLKEAQSEINKQKEVLELGEKQLLEGKKELDKAKAEFISQGIDPDKDTTELKSNLENLKSLDSKYKSISSDIKNTVSNLEGGGEIPLDKIQSWKNTISDQSLGLTNLIGSINELEKQPSDISIANNIASSIDKASDNIGPNMVSLETLLGGINKYQQGKNQIEQQLVVLNNGKAQLKQGQEQITKAKADITKGEKELQKGKTQGKIELDKAQKEIAKGEKELLEGEREIPLDKIQSWKNTISDQSLGLTNLTGLINELEKQPSDISIANNIASSIDKASDNIGPNMVSLETLLGGITKYQQGKNQIEQQLVVLNNGKAQLKQGQEQITKAKADITKGEKELQKGKTQGKIELDKAQKEIAKGEKELLEGETKLNEEKEKLAELTESNYMFFTRNDNPGHSSLGDSIKSLDNIASVLPVFFFLVAILICLTTMTRMVEENRIEMGTLKALGYNNVEISKKYVIYASLASISGSVLGILIGCSILPHVISDAYGSLFSLPKLTIYYYPSYIIQSIGISILCTAGATIFVLWNELKSSPSNLMKPKSPKLGKKILLERITPLWNKFSFKQKVTFRNIFRYKQRMIMTILGIAGCMALLVTGFGIKDSNLGVLEKQFNKLWDYDAMIIFNEDADKKGDEQYQRAIDNIKGFESSLNMQQESVTFEKEDMNKQTATLYVPENTKELEKFILLNDRISGEKFEISDEGVIINEKLAKLLQVKVGDSITMMDKDNNPYKVKVDNITENYLMHAIYMSPASYEKVFGKKPIYNSQYLKYDTSKNNEDEISQELLEGDKVINVTLTSQIKKSTSESTANMDMVMLVILIASGCLAFVVLYNLNNINVSERIRELSTIKVLGFYDNEVTMYILRENVILTLLGVITGSFLGKILHSFIITTAETDNMMMYPVVSFKSFIFSALITIFFSLVVMVMMHIKLRNVNMIDALKSNE